MTIALLTDFGPGSVYVGQMKAVIAGIVPNFPLVDLCHDIAPGTPEAIVGEAGFLLERSRRYFARNTIFTCVVDPGVGTDRRVLLAEIGQHLFIAPDNGLLAPTLDQAPDAHVIAVTEERWYLPGRSQTFHGRDVFAALAGHVARGLRWTTLGRGIDAREVVRLGPPATAAAGRVRSVDRWGNLVTDVTPAGGLERVASLAFPGTPAPVIGTRARTFAEGSEQAPFIVLGGLGTLEIACRGRSAAALLGVERGAAVEVGYVA